MTTILIKVIGFDTYCNDFTLGLNTVWVEIHIEAIYSLFACDKFPFFITIVPVAVVIRPKTVTNQLASVFLKIIGISIGLIGALVCILTQQSDDLASDAFTGNMLCLLSSVVYAVYLILSQRILTAIGAITMLRYTFSGAAVSAIIVTFITGFDAPVFSMPFHWTPFLILMFVLIFPTTISYMLLPVGLKYLKTTVVAIYGYLILIVATIASLALGQDRFSWTQTFAIIFICIGVYLVEVAESKER